MKKLCISAISILALSALFVVSCKIKNNDNITPTYRNQSTGTGANPNINVVTVTGQQEATNPATQNSSLQVGSLMSGWAFDGCVSHPNYFLAKNGSTIIKVEFASPITTGTFALTAGIPNMAEARITVYGAPGQPDEVVWYSKSGSVTVTFSGGIYKASFTNIPCLQQNFLFPTVTLSGDVIC